MPRHSISVTFGKKEFQIDLMRRKRHLYKMSMDWYKYSLLRRPHDYWE